MHDVREAPANRKRKDLLGFRLEGSQMCLRLKDLREGEAATHQAGEGEIEKVGR